MQHAIFWFQCKAVYVWFFLMCLSFDFLWHHNSMIKHSIVPNNRIELYSCTTIYSIQFNTKLTLLYISLYIPHAILSLFWNVYMKLIKKNHFAKAALSAYCVLLYKDDFLSLSKRIRTQNNKKWIPDDNLSLFVAL